MILINVRKGQFVYYNNRLCKVYAVKHFFRQSVHLIRLADFEQELATAKEIDLYKPKHLDSFLYNQKRYTLHKDVQAQVGDYILVINPRPDSLDHHHLHAIEMVSSIETNGVISNKSNGIKHNEYWVMVPGLEKDAQMIDFQHLDPNEQDIEKIQEIEVIDTSDLPETYTPKIGDIFQKNDTNPIIQAMIIAIQGNTVYLGGGLKESINDLTNTDIWSYVMNVME